MSGSFHRLAFKQAVIKAPSPIVEGKRSGAMLNIATVEVLPLMPVSRDVVQRMALQTPVKLLMTYFEAENTLSFAEGYVLALDGVDYPIKALNAWDARMISRTTYELVVEDTLEK